MILVSVKCTNTQELAEHGVVKVYDVVYMIGSKKFCVPAFNTTKDGWFVQTAYLDCAFSTYAKDFNPKNSRQRRKVRKELSNSLVKLLNKSPKA